MFKPSNFFVLKVLNFLLSSNSASMYSIVERGTPGLADYRIFFKHSSTGKIVSPFHDIPLVADATRNLYNMVVEIPRGTNEKMEIATKEKFNPIKQDVKKGKLRFVSDLPPHKGYPFNYGALPQTWENPNFTDENTKCCGDNDPIDVCEIGAQAFSRGSVIPVKILGVLALIDDGETDWKLIVVNANDKLADQLGDIKSIETVLPGVLKSTHDWFRDYKIPDGNPPNKFAFDGEVKDAKFANHIIEETHHQWKDLIYHGKPENHGLELTNSTLEKSKYKVDPIDENGDL